ncbi:MAG: hypothetical protein ABFE07_19310 [Armatimonadia bacterium]
MAGKLSSGGDRTPPECCRYCLGDAGGLIPHRQLTRAESDNPALRPVTRATHLSRARLLRGLAVRCSGELKHRSQSRPCLR